jgi:hypothetical protein
MPRWHETRDMDLPFHHAVEPQAINFFCIRGAEIGKLQLFFTAFVSAVLLLLVRQILTPRTEELIGAETFRTDFYLVQFFSVRICLFSVSFLSSTDPIAINFAADF